MSRLYTYFLVFTYVFIFIHFGYAQHSFDNENQVFANATDAEKIYLQLTGTTFYTSETIWYKAIVTDVIKNTPSTKSGVLHVELIDLLNNQIVEENLLKLNDGTTNGFFQLHSSYREGKYMIRAYTDWNKNFGSDFITSIPVNIFRLQKDNEKPDPIRNIFITKDPNSRTYSLSSKITIKALDSLHSGDAMLYVDWKGGKDTILIKEQNQKLPLNVRHDVPQNVPIINYRLKTRNEVFKKAVILNDEYSSLQFFPEGGALVDSLQSVVGFKYLNYKGKGAQIEGWIEDENNNKVVEFKSNALGMGKVILTPEAEKSYYGVLTTESGKLLRYKLPKVKKKGQVLSLTNKEPNWLLRIWNKYKNRDSLFVKLFHRGKNLVGLKARFRNGMFSYSIMPEDLPQGVIGLTVYDKNYRPVAERHFFNPLNSENLDVKMKTDKDSYFTRDSVQVNITTRQNNKPISASVSIMAIDSGYFYGTNLDKNNIVSYFLLQSDIKGKIENPSYYFDKSKNMIELDHLMLTQGWTNYKYKERQKPKTINPEKNLRIEGNVNAIQSGSNRANSNKKYLLNMLMMGESLEAKIIETDSTGYFKVELNDSYGYGRKFLIQPEKTSHKTDRLEIDIKNHEIPEITYESEKVLVPIDSIIEKKIKQKMVEDIKLESPLLANTITLDTVELSDYKITPERAAMLEMHGKPDLVINNQELINKKKKWTNNLYRWLLFNYPSAIRVERVGNRAGFELAYVYGAEWTYVVIDGIPVHEIDYEYIENIPVSAVKRVEILQNTQTANTYFNEVFDCAPLCAPPSFPAILAIYTYSGKGLFGSLTKQKNNNLLRDMAPQYTPVREYYAPEYHESSKINWDVPDRRRLLFWKPDIITNGEGEARLSFFNGDRTGKMLIICEGITSNGKVGYSELFYEVDNP